MENAQILARGNQVDAVRLDDHPLFGLVDAHARVARQQLVHHAAVIGREMLDDDEGKVRIRRHDAEELLDGFETAG